MSKYSHYNTFHVLKYTHVRYAKSLFINIQTFAFKNDLRNLENFHQSTNSQNWDFDWILLCKLENVCLRLNF